jgi:hypothetical protein
MAPDALAVVDKKSEFHEGSYRLLFPIAHL